MRARVRARLREVHETHKNRKGETRRDETKRNEIRGGKGRDDNAKEGCGTDDGDETRAGDNNQR